MSTCFFIGHREAEDSLYAPLAEEIGRHIVQYGVSDFIVGRYGNFDRLAARAVMDAKRLYPGVKLTLLLPYPPFIQLDKTPPGFDGTIYPYGMETVPRNLAIVRANRYMVGLCDYLIAYAWRPASNARNLVEYARARQKKGLLSVVNLAAP